MTKRMRGRLAAPYRQVPEFLAYFVQDRHQLNYAELRRQIAWLAEELIACGQRDPLLAEEFSAAPLNELIVAMKWSDAGKIHPLFAKNRVQIEKASTIVGHAIFNKEAFYHVAAWALACLRMLVFEGRSKAEARKLVAKATYRDVPAIRKWERRFEREGGRIDFETHFDQQSLYSKVEDCLRYAQRNDLSGTAMLKLFKADPALVVSLSIKSKCSPNAGEPAPQLFSCDFDGLLTRFRCDAIQTSFDWSGSTPHCQAT